MRVVVDASFVASLFLPDERSEKSDRLAGSLEEGDATAPALLQLEVMNILIMALRRKRITGSQRKQLSEAFDGLAVVLQPALTRNQRSEVLRLAEKHGLSAYDAVYLELAMRLGVALASLDGGLVKAAKGEGVKVAV